MTTWLSLLRELCLLDSCLIDDTSAILASRAPSLERRVRVRPHLNIATDLSVDNVFLPEFLH